MDSVVATSETAKRANFFQNFKWGIIGLALGGGFFILVLVGLDRFKLISFSDILKSFKPASNTKTAQPFVPAGGPPIVLAELTPVPTGNPFKEAVMIKDTSMALFVIGGSITDIQDMPDGSGRLIFAQESNGRAIKEPMFAPKDTRVKLMTTVNGEQTETQITLNDIKKGDGAVVSYAFDIQTGKGQISGIIISRVKK